MEYFLNEMSNQLIKIDEFYKVKCRYNFDFTFRGQRKSFAAEMPHVFD